MSERPPVRVGFLSAVRHAGPYAAILAAEPDIEVVGVAEPAHSPSWVRSDSERAAAAMGVPLHDQVDDLLGSGAVDVVVVCSEPTRHAELAIQAVRAGIPALVDKPVAVSVAEVDRLAAVARETGTPVGVVNRSLSPAVQRVRRWVDAGHLGLPLHVDVEWYASGAHFATSVERPELVVDPALAGGGELLNFLLYPVDYIRTVTGLDVLEVHCEAATLFSELHRAHGAEDAAVCSLRLDHGVTATVTLARVPAAPGLGPVTSTMRVLGSHGQASSDDDLPAVRVHRGDGGVECRPVDGPSSDAILRRLLAPTLIQLAAGDTPDYTLADARAALAVTEAAYRSVTTGQPAEVSPPPPTS
ncbi:Gfo/Idh/MocA family oxidoreductase [Phycicoccus sp. M110.8]|uniref:Gfo/Idh/MocA family protein n=1 Tax=Phycicoccus sp. M110.8 TaxID=3075433 RepID=UPI0028FD5D8F|nr:Gfo/Idh/MocA family oxidoreductase [Phycicoccus sp. M110.8]MDU0313143.1 Gfo/Idh/MocA family oxidoreductase [Phycicoccus sp. M110.8]